MTDMFHVMTTRMTDMNAKEDHMTQAVMAIMEDSEDEDIVDHRHTRRAETAAEKDTQTRDIIRVNPETKGTAAMMRSPRQEVDRETPREESLKGKCDHHH
jgi:hypothetical protein